MRVLGDSVKFDNIHTKTPKTQKYRYKLRHDIMSTSRITDLRHNIQLDSYATTVPTINIYKYYIWG